MTKKEKLLEKARNNPNGLNFQEFTRLMSQAGWILDHQTGSHLILRQAQEPHRRLTVPNHREIARGTLLAIIKQAGLTRDQFLYLL